jgi:hypothetical protein
LDALPGDLEGEIIDEDRRCKEEPVQRQACAEPDDEKPDEHQEHEGHADAGKELDGANSRLDPDAVGHLPLSHRG